MARYWINGGVNNNWNAITNWSASSGGTGGSPLPTSNDAVNFDANGDVNCIHLLSVDNSRSVLSLIKSVDSFDCDAFLEFYDESEAITANIAENKNIKGDKVNPYNRMSYLRKILSGSRIDNKNIATNKIEKICNNSLLVEYNFLYPKNIPKIYTGI